MAAERRAATQQEQRRPLGPTGRDSRRECAATPLRSIVGRFIRRTTSPHTRLRTSSTLPGRTSSSGWYRTCGVISTMQPCDLDICQHVRRNYVAQEFLILQHKIQLGDAVPELSDMETMKVIMSCWENPERHITASTSFLKNGMAVALDGSEDFKICREAKVFWDAPTSQGYVNMRASIDAELKSVEESWKIMSCSGIQIV